MKKLLLILTVLVTACGGGNNTLYDALTQCRGSKVLGVFIDTEYAFSATQSCGLKITELLTGCVMNGMFTDLTKGKNKGKLHWTVKKASPECNLVTPRSFNMYYEVINDSIDFDLN